MAAKLSDTPKKVGDGKDIVCFLLGGSWYTCMVFHFPFHFILHLSIYFPFAYSAFALSAAQPAKKCRLDNRGWIGRAGRKLV